jgi:Glycine zipper 2TM domain
MNKVIALLVSAAALGTAVPAIAQTASDTARLQDAQRRFNSELSVYRSQNTYRNSNRNMRAQDRLDTELTNFRQELDRYQGIVRNSRSYGRNNGYQPGTTGGRYEDDSAYYDPSRDYRDGNYQERVLANDDRVYRGTDGRYYCKRNDGTTGLIVGGVGGAVLGNVIDGGRSRAVGTILGGLLGAVAGRAVERGANDRNGEIRCR